MDILNWKQNSWSGRELGLYAAEQPLGKLKFIGWTSYDAKYTTGNTSITFKTKGFFDQDIAVLYNGEEIGSASVSTLTGKAKLHLLTGELYTMKSSLLSSNRTVQDTAGKTLISFKQPALGFGKGIVEVSEELSDLTKEVLVSTSLYLKSVTEQQVAIMIAIFVPVLSKMAID